jgi:hypothetical protein
MFCALLSSVLAPAEVLVALAQADGIQGGGNGSPSTSLKNPAS